MVQVAALLLGALLAVLVAQSPEVQARHVLQAKARKLRCPSSQSVCERSKGRGRSTELVCINLRIDTQNCGTCNSACGVNEVCTEGVCTPAITPPVVTASCGTTGAPCATGLTCCTDRCVNTSSAVDSCGACGRPCLGDQICDNGQCKFAAQPETGTPPGGALATNIQLDPFDTCDASGNPISSITSCATNTQVPGYALTITQANFLSLGVYPTGTWCLKVSTCNQAQLAQWHSGNTVVALETATVLGWSKPDSLPDNWSVNATQCAAGNCGDGSALSQILLRNTGRDEVVYVHNYAGSCMRNVYVMLSVEPTCEFTADPWRG